MPTSATIPARSDAATLAGAALLAGAWLGPLPALAAQSMSAHMVLHLTLVALVPALLARPLPGGSGPAVLAAAVVAEMAAVWAWHAPALHHWARESGTGFVLEQASFLVVGLFLWSAALSASRPAGALVLLLTTMHMTLLGALIGLAPVTLYGHGGGFGLTALEDQQLAGALMAGLGGAVYLVGALVRLAPALRLEGAR